MGFCSSPILTDAYTENGLNKIDSFYLLWVDQLYVLI